MGQVATDGFRSLQGLSPGLGGRWTFGEPEPEELDAEVLVWWMHTRLDTSGLPDRRSVLHLRFTDDPQPFWLVIESGDPSICLTDPGYDVDVTVTSDLSTLYEVWLGHLPIKKALREQRLSFDGPTALTRRMPLVFQLRPMAETVSANRSP